MLLFVRYQVILFGVGGHRVTRRRRRSSALLALLLAPAAVFFAAGADVHPDSAKAKPDAACCLELVAATPIADDVSAIAFAASRMPAASRWRVDVQSRFLPLGKAPEKGLQVKTILVERSISLAFPEIQNMGGVRPDGLRWHPEGLAVDGMIREETIPGFLPARDSRRGRGNDAKGRDFGVSSIARAQECSLSVPPWIG